MSIEIQNNIVQTFDDTHEEYLHDSLERLAKIKKLSEPKFQLSEGCKKGTNFLGIVYRVTIEGQRDGEKQTISVIVKRPPENILFKKYARLMLCFAREIEFYEKVLPTFKKLLNKYGLTVNYIPTYYWGNNKENEEILILEDLNSKGFTMKDKPTHLDYPHLSLALRHIGQLHAYSFALRDQKPEDFKNLKVEEAFFRKNLDLGIYIKKRYDTFAEMVKLVLVNDDKHYTERFEAFYNEYWNNMVEACEGERAEPYAVISHGDAWTNNMMFKYNKGILDPNVMYFFDFQLYRYASPALDLLYMLFTCCNQNMRDQYYDQLLHDYHDSLSECLIKLGSDPKKLFPFEVLLDQLRKFGKFGAGMSLVVTHVFTCNEVIDIPKTNEYNDDLIKLRERIDTDEMYRTTLRNVFKDLIDRNYI